MRARILALASALALPLLAAGAPATPLDATKGQAMEDVMARFGILYGHAMEAVTTTPHPALQDEVVFSFGSLAQDVLSDMKIRPDEVRQMSATVRQALCGRTPAPGVDCHAVQADLDRIEAAYAQPAANDAKLGESIGRLMPVIVDWASAREGQR